MSTFIERPFDANFDGKALTNSNDQTVGQRFLDEVRDDFLRGFRGSLTGTDQQHKEHGKYENGLSKIHVCKEDEQPNREERLDKLAKILESTDQLSEDTKLGNALEKLFGKASQFGGKAMDRLVEQLNERLKDSDRMLKVRPKDGRMPPSGFTITLFDLKANRNLGSVDAEGQGKK